MQLMLKSNDSVTPKKTLYFEWKIQCFCEVDAENDPCFSPESYCYIVYRTGQAYIVR
jgi:hypothetical protein